MPHAALWVVQRRKELHGGLLLCGFNAARGFVGGATSQLTLLLYIFSLVSMPHAALWVVQLASAQYSSCSAYVSMPHAALWVVQLSMQFMTTTWK